MRLTPPRLARNTLLICALALAAGIASAAGALAARTDVVLGLRLEPPHLDPTAGAAAAIDDVVFMNVFQGLTKVTEHGTVAPCLAKSWTISRDGKTYVFKLQKNVTFHDGTPFTADDVVFSYNRARGPESVNAQKAKFTNIESVTADAPDQVTVVLKHPSSDFLFNMGTGDASIVSPKSADTNKTHPIGTGPFKFQSWTKGDQIVLLRNDAYWGEKPALTKATFKFISDPAAAMASLMAGDVDGFPIYPTPENLPQFEADPRFTVEVGSTEGEVILGLNNSKPPFNNLKVRQAIAHAINRKALIDGAMFGYGTPIGSHFPPNNPAYEDLTDTYPYDLKEAKKLLTEAGYPNGFTTVMKLPPPSYARRSGEILASDFKKIGINVEIVPVEWAQWLDQVFKNKDYGMSIIAHVEPNDIDIYARDDYYFGYHNPAFKTLMDKINLEQDPTARNALLRKAQEILAKDAVNGFLFELPKTGVWDARLKGLWANAPIEGNDLSAVHWEQ